MPPAPNPIIFKERIWNHQVFCQKNKTLCEKQSKKERREGGEGRGRERREGR
jgi:hypothetical protein